MKYFVFRNNTIESLFAGIDCAFSGYDDISNIPEEAQCYIWFYQPSLKFEYEKLVNEVNSYKDKLRLIYSQIPKDKTLIVLTLEDIFSARIIDGDYSLQNAINSFNESAISLSSENSNVKIVDFSRFIRRYSKSEVIDWKYYFISQMPISPRLAKPFKAWFISQLDGMALKRKKCLVLDLDNTLWGGVLGEDGINGIKIGGDYPGKAFLYFQQALIELGKSGVILTICSKNNEQDVLEAWEKNPYILLKQEHISAYRINWQDKATNIKELADELNIGLDSFVFIDDNPTERELVKQVLPMVEVPEFPVQPYNLPMFYKSIIDQHFHIYSITTEDKQKTAQYKANAERAKLQDSFNDLTDFIRSLDIQIKIEQANDFNISRIAQMTQKTNQFNLTTKRYTESDIWQFLENDWRIWCISVSDKFGDNGITGCIMVNGDSIDSLLLSCRILGKGIEKAFVKYILYALKESGLKTIYAQYIPTAKNMQVATFYDVNGFECFAELENGTKEYRIDLDAVTLEIEEYYHIS